MNVSSFHLLAQSGLEIQGGSSPGVPLWWYLVPVAALAALVTAVFFYRSIMARSEGTEPMREIAQAVREGAYAYLKRQYLVVAVFFGLVFLILLGLSFAGLQSGFSGPAFLTGGLLSGLAGFLGMKTATSASARTAQAASESLNRGLQVSFRAGAVMGLCVVGLAMLGIAGWFLYLNDIHGLLFGQEAALSIPDISMIMLSMGLGASSMALFARVGGGIFTKAADVGADLVGKVEAGIPEDDPRNPATIADNVGDNVGDVAGMGADLFESYMGSILACVVLGAAAAAGIGADVHVAMNYVAAPMLLSAVGIFLSILGVLLVRTRENADIKALIRALDKGIYSAGALTILAAAVICQLLGLGWGIWASILTGIVIGGVIGKATEYYTAAEYSPTRRISASAESGQGPLIISGLAEGMISTWIPILVVAVGMIAAFVFAGGLRSPEEGGGTLFGLYGIGIAAVGMLSTLGVTLASDAYGPIADNAGGNAEMAGLPPEVRQRTDALDALGNTTAAIGKGFAIGSAALTALALLASYAMTVQEMHAPAVGAASGETAQAPVDLLGEFAARYDISLLNPKVLGGIFLGVMLVYIFSAMTMKAVGRAAMEMVQEVRRQFREKPGIMTGQERPDYKRCVTISTGSAQREIIRPTLLAIGMPILVGLVLDVPGVIGLLVGGLCAGYAMAVFMANAGGAWDNAKKYIEEGHHGGKGSAPHKAAVVGDTVGDPFKDTSGPSLNILIKLMNIVSIVFAGLVVELAPLIGKALGLH